MARRSPQTERLVEMIEFLAAIPQREYRLAELARLVELDDATCYPMLTELTRVGWLVKDRVRKTYRLGPRLIALGAAAQASLQVATCARPELHRLTNDIGMTSCLILPSSNDLVIAEVAHPEGQAATDFLLQPGDHIEFRPPLGSVFVAWSNQHARDTWLQRGDAFSADPARSLGKLALIRDRGFAVELAPASLAEVSAWANADLGDVYGSRRAELLSDRQRPALTPDLLLGDVDLSASYSPMALSAPVFDTVGNAVGAVSILTAAQPAKGDRILALGAHVRDAAARITDHLKASPPVSG